MQPVSARDTGEKSSRPALPEETQHRPVHTGLQGTQRIFAITPVFIAVALATLDAAIANTALPTIAADVHAHPADSIWIVNAYQLALMVTVLPFASLGEILGYRRIYIFGLCLFTLASLVCAFAWSLPSLTVARAFQGIGAGVVVSVNTALVRFIYPPRMLGRAVGLIALVVAVSSAIGPTVASGILSFTTWPGSSQSTCPSALSRSSLRR
jgi:DHA2 family multidrug resistance protein-like MFS transporter